MNYIPYEKVYSGGSPVSHNHLSTTTNAERLS